MCHNTLTLLYLLYLGILESEEPERRLVDRDWNWKLRLTAIFTPSVLITILVYTCILLTIVSGYLAHMIYSRGLGEVNPGGAGSRTFEWYWELTKKCWSILYRINNRDLRYLSLFMHHASCIMHHAPSPNLKRPYSYPSPIYPSPAELVKSIEANLEKVELVRSHSNICFYIFSDTYKLRHS